MFTVPFTGSFLNRRLEIGPLIRCSSNARIELAHRHTPWLLPFRLSNPWNAVANYSLRTEVMTFGLWSFCTDSILPPMSR